MMAQKSEGSLKSCKGLSFIDWDDLNAEEFEKLDKIINSNSCPAVQLPFSTDDEKSYVQSVMATVYQPAVPPAITGYSFPFHWAHGDPAVCTPDATHYAIAIQGGYACPNPGLATSRETPVPFMSAESGVQPVYSVPGHHYPPHYQSMPLPQSEPVDLSLSARPPVELLNQRPSHHEDLVPTGTLIHPVTVSQAAQDVSLASDISHQPSLGHQAIQQPLHTQAVYISQTSAVPPPIPILSNGSENSASSDKKCAAAAPQSVSLQRPLSIEFGGPIVYTNSPTDHNKLLQASDSFGKTLNQQVVIDMEDVSISDIAKSEHSENKNILISNAKQPDQPQAESHAVNSSPVITNHTITAIKENIQEPVNSLGNQNTINETLVAQTAPPQPKMWSSLFGSKGSNSTLVGAHVASRPSETVTAAAAMPNAVVVEEVKSVKYWQEQEKAEAKQAFVPTDKILHVGVQKDPLAPKILNDLTKLSVSHTPIVIQPRGLVNGSNTCFMNATLQVLMGCPPFVRMFQEFKNLPPRPGSYSSTPIFDSLIQFVNSFQNGQRMRNQGSRNKKSTCTDINVGQPFSPTALLNVAQNILGLRIGVQQDAEEFLSRILMICHEELENVLKLSHSNSLNNNDGEHTKNGLLEIAERDAVEGDDIGDGDNDDESWLKVGPKNHHVETNVNDCGRTPLSSIFAGLSRSCLQRESGKTSDTVDSFFTLKLDIQAESVRSVTDALLRLNTVETVHDVDGGKVHGQRRMFFDVLPPVLIMHLKLFQYSNGNGQKIQKKIDFDVDLIIPKETLSRVGKAKLASLKSRTYKLFGVVNHHGMKMNDGHYTSDVYLPVANGWLHFDDSEVTHIHEAQVLQYSERWMPYLLFYRRMDL